MTRIRKKMSASRSALRGEMISASKQRAAARNTARRNPKKNAPQEHRSRINTTPALLLSMRSHAHASGKRKARHQRKKKINNLRASTRVDNSAS